MLNMSDRHVNVLELGKLGAVLLQYFILEILLQIIITQGLFNFNDLILINFN